MKVTPFSMEGKSILENFKRDGFVVLKNYVDQDLITDLLQDIEKLDIKYQDEYGDLRKDKRFEKLEEFSPNMMKLYNGFIDNVGKIFLNSNNEFIDGQISLMEHGRPQAKDWHIDGTWIAKKNNSFEGIPFFKLLVGVYLTDLTKTNSANLLVSPGGHFYVENFFKVLDENTIKNDVSLVFENLYKIKIPDLIPVLVSPGDVVIAHALLPHNVSKNEANNRPVIYFRLGKYKNDGYKALSSLWGEWSI